MIELVICHCVASKMSFYHAGWDYPESARREKQAANLCWNAWLQCRKWLIEHDLYDEFKQSGNYLI